MKPELKAETDWYPGITEKHFDLAIAKAVAAHVAKIERLQRGHDRYETARRMNPQQWDLAWKTNASTGKPFDEIIDNMAEFLTPKLKRYAIKDVTRCYDCPHFSWEHEICSRTGRNTSGSCLPNWCPLPSEPQGAL